MKTISYIWTVVLGLVEISVTISLFGSNYVSDPFQTKVLALLVIIYTTIRTLGIGLGQTVLNTAVLTDASFKKLQKMSPGYLRDVAAEEEEKAAQEELSEKIRRMNIKSIINSIIVAIMYLIAVYNLFSSL
jgi:hypothetical protein